ncbi:MAG: Gfo/Idh/MocA family protein [Phycisphaeraceae bacterium]
MINLAVIGMGGRASGLLRLARQLDLPFKLSAIVDPSPDSVRQRLRQRELHDGLDVPVFANIDRMLASGAPIDGIIVGTRCNLHAPLAVQLAERGVDVPILLEKPVAISEEQLTQLARAYAGRGEKVVVSFPLRVTPLFRKALEIVQSGRLGAINQIQAHNNVSYGGVYFGNWYRDFDTTGGLWLQKATHDFDYLNALAGSAPLVVAATHARRVYGGDMPENLRCSECDRTETCVESPQNLKKRRDTGGMPIDDHLCAFSESIKNQDAGSALLMYENGLHAAYSQNFVTRRTAGRRGACVTGYHATLTFDWRDNIVRVIDHHDEPRITEWPITTAEDDHGGGDSVLLRNFFDLIRGEAASHTPLEQGLLSAAMCLAARKSANTWTFQPIALPDQPQPASALAPPQMVEA